jgi:hypothetical protein
MHKRTATFVLIAGLASASSLQAQTFTDVKQYVLVGDKTKDAAVTLTIGEDSLTVTGTKNAETVIPFTAITGATYDRRARQRKMLGVPMTGQSMAGAATKLQHFLTVKYKTETTADFVELELGKDIANRVIATLEAKSGKTVEKVGS